MRNGLNFWQMLQNIYLDGRHSACYATYRCNTTKFSPCWRHILSQVCIPTHLQHPNKSEKSYVPTPLSTLLGVVSCVVMYGEQYLFIGVCMLSCTMLVKNSQQSYCEQEWYVVTSRWIGSTDQFRLKTTSYINS